MHFQQIIFILSEIETTSCVTYRIFMKKNYKSIYVLLRNSTKVPRFEGFSYY